jgi:autotransporter-associated beta strand protein
MKIWIVAFWMALLAGTLRARNVDLSTVPERKTVQLTIYNSEDLTLVRETRIVTFKKGANPLQFSWANTLIDPTSVELKFLTSPDKLEVLDTTYPHDKPQMLYWNVQSELDGEATIQITYFTSGISWAADYLCIADPEEKQMNFEGFVRVRNNSGEEYEDAQVRLVVGSINLVEKIAQLARIPVSDVEALDGKLRKDLRTEAGRLVLSGANSYSGGTVISSGTLQLNEKQITKEGLSEYFIYTIEGTETIRNGWSKRMRSLEGQTIPFKIQYRYRPEEYGDQLVRMYLLANNKESKLGTTPLPDGIVRVFRQNGRDGLSYLTQQQIKYVPIGDKIELNLGADPNVIFELIKLRSARDNIWMHLGSVDVFRRVDDGAGDFDINSTVAGWDDRSIFSQRIRNYSTRPIDVEVRRPWDGHVVFRSALNPVLHDFRTPQFTATIPAATKTDLLFEVLHHQGRNARQNNVTLETAEVKP